MAKETDGLLLTASLNIEETANIIKKEDIAKLNNKLANDDAARVKIVGGLDLNKTQSLIQSQIATISKNLKLNIGQIDFKGIGNTQNITNSFNNIQAQANKVTNSLTNLADEFKKPIKPVLNTEGLIDAEKTIEKVQKRFSELGNISVKGIYGEKLGDDQLEKMIVNIKNAQNEVRTLTFQIGELFKGQKKLGNNDLFYLTSGTSDNAGIEKFITATQKAQDKIKALRISLTADIVAIRNAWKDENSSKSVKSEENIKNLELQYSKTLQTIKNLRNADDTTMASMKSNAEAQIQKLSQMVSQYHNAEKVATQLRAKGFETVKIDTGNNIDKFINSINNSKVPIQAMQSEIDNLTSSFAKLDAIKDQAEKSSALTNILNTLDNAKTKFQSLKELFKGFNKADWLTVNSEQINKIDDMATKIAIYKNNLSATRDEWKSQGIYVGEIQAKTASLARSLSGIKKPEKFNKWVDEWTSLNQKATQLKANLDSQVAVQNKIYETQIKISNLNPTKNAEEISLLNSKLEAQQKELSNLQAQANVYVKLLSYEKQEQYVSEQTAKTREKLATANAKSNDKATVQRTSEMNSYKESIDKVISQLNVLNNSTVFVKNSSNPQVSQIKQQIAQLITEYQTLKTTLNGNFTPNDIPNVLSKFKELDTQFQQVIISAKNLKSSISADNSMQKQAQNAELLVEKVKKLRSEIIAYKNANSKAMKSQATSSNGITYSAEIDGFLAKLKNASSVTDAEFKKISASFRTLKAEVKSAGLEGSTMLSSLWANVKKFSNWMGITMVTASIAREIRGMFTDVAELDEALIDLRKTFNGTSEDLQNFYYSANDVAKQLGVTTQEVITQASAWSRLGYNTTEAVTQLSKTSSIFAAISPEMDVDTATNTLVSVLKAYEKYGLKAEDALDGIASKINEIGNNFAVSNSDIAEALQRSSASMASANTDLDHTIALITAGNEIAQSPESVGNALKTISMRIRGMNEETGELDGTLQTISGDVYELTHGQVSIMQDADTYKDIYTILDDINKIWDTLTDKEHATLTEKLFGKQRGNIGSAIISNFEQARKAIDTMNNSEGGAMREMEVIMDSVSYKANELKETLVGIAQDSITQDFLKSILESATRILNTLSDASSPLNFILTQIANLLELVTKLTDKIGVIPTILGGLTLKNAGVFKTLGTSLSNFINKSWTDTVKDFKISGISSLIKDSDTIALQKFNQELKAGTDYHLVYDNVMKSASSTAKKQALSYIKCENDLKRYNTQLNSGKLKQEEYNTRVDTTKAKMASLGVETETVSLKTKLATTGFQMLKAVLSSIAFMFIIQGISYLVKGLSDLSNNVEKTKEKVKSLTDEFDTAISSANDNAKKTEDLVNDYEKLSRGVNNLGENVSLTNDEYDKYKSIANEIADMFPNLIQGYDNEGNAILNLKGNVEQLRDAYKEAQKEAYNLLIIGGKDANGNDVIKQWQDTQDTNFWAKLFDFGATDVGKGISISEAIEQLEAFENMSEQRYKQIQEIYTAAYSDSTGIFDTDFAKTYAELAGYKPLSDVEYDIIKNGFVEKYLGLNDKMSDDDFTNAKKQAKALVQKYNAEIESDLSSVKSLANAYLMNSDDYDKLDEQSKKSASVLINSLDKDIANSFTTQPKVAEYVNKIIESFDNVDVKNAINNLFTLDTSNISVNDINSQVDKYIDIIASAIGEDSDKLKIRLGFEDTDNVLNRAKAKFNIQANSAMKGLQDEIDNFLGNLTLDDLNIAMQIPDLFDDGLSKASEKIANFKADPNNNLTPNFDYATYSEQVDDVVKNIDKVQSALDKLNSGKTIDGKDITELANAFPEYSTKILSASNDTEKLKSVLTEIKTNAPQSLIDTLTNLKDLSEDDKEAVNGLITVLSNLNSASSTYSDMLSDLETKENLLSTAYKEMHDDGQVSIGTYQKLIDSGLDYSEAIEIANGQITVNVKKLKELTEEKSKAEIETLKLARAELIYNSALAVAGGINVSEEIANIDREIEAKQKTLEFLEGFDYTTTAKTTTSKENKPQSVLDFETEYARKQHEINMGRMEEDEDYYSWLENAAHTAYDGLKDYEEDLWKYEEEVYKYRTEREQKLFDKKISNLEKLADKALDDKIEIQNVNKELEDFNKKMQSEYGLGNVDLTKRPKVDMGDGTTATVLSSSEFLWQGDEENGEYVAVHYTPILPDGTILDDDTLAKYLYETLEGSDDILKADTKGLVLKVDTGLNITDEDINSLETDNPTQHIQDIIKACDDWDVSLHEIQEQWVELSNASENTTSTVTNKFDYARKQINSAISDIQERIDGIKNGTISGNADDIEELEDDLDSLYDKLTDINEKEIDSQKEYIKTLKDEYSDLIDEQIDGQKKLADNIEKAYEKQIDNIDKQIDAINKVNEAEERQKNILEAQQAVKEAQRDLDKANRNTRLVLTRGGYELRSDKDAVEEAKKNLADKQAELQKAMDEQKIAILEEQKEALESQKKASKDYYDKVTSDLEEQKTAREKQYDLLIDIYEQLGGEKKQTSLNDNLVAKLTANGDINKAVQSLTPTELQQAIQSGVLTTDSDGNYDIDYSILDENEKAVNDNTAELKKTESELEKLNSSISGNADTSADMSKVDTSKPYLDANGYLVDADGKQILNDGKPIHAKKKEDSNKGLKKTDLKVPRGDGEFAGYNSMNDLFKAMTLGEFSIPQNIVDSFKNINLPNRITEGMSKLNEQVVTNSEVSNNNSPVINFTVQVEGSADEKTIQAMKTEVGNALISYTDKLISAIPVSSMRRQNKS